MERKEERGEILAESEGCGNWKLYGDKGFKKESKFLALITEYGCELRFGNEGRELSFGPIFETTAKHSYRRSRFTFSNMCKNHIVVTGNTRRIGSVTPRP